MVQNNLEASDGDPISTEKNDGTRKGNSIIEARKRIFIFFENLLI